MSGIKQQTLFQSWGNKAKEGPSEATAPLAMNDDEEDEMLALAMEESLKYAATNEMNSDEISVKESTRTLDPQPSTSGYAKERTNTVAKAQWTSLFKTVGQSNSNQGDKTQTSTANQLSNTRSSLQQSKPKILTTDDVPDELLPDPSQFPDLPGFDKVAGRIWIYPTNYPVREYQFDIVYKALFENTLCVLPTGLGKTFIAAVVMYNFYRWYPSGKIVFMAPTKPLVAQQIEACYNIMGIPQTDTAEMTGAMQPSERKRAWHSKRIFFLTPQVMVNDLTRGAFPAEYVRCLVCDEAHKATGNHAYCQVVRELSRHTDQYRILALSATPGGDIKAVQTVVTNMNISNIELRGEDSDDIRPYTHERVVDKIVVPLGEELTAVREKYFSVVSLVVNRLQRQGVLYKRDVKSLSKFLILKSREAFRQNPPMNMPRNQVGIVEGDFALCMSLYHGYELLQQHGLRSLTNFLEGLMSGEKGYGSTRTELQRNAVFCDLLDDLRAKFKPIKAAIPHTQVTQDHGTPGKPVVTGHPKMKKLEEVALEHFHKFQESEGLDEKGGVKTRIMIFSQYRDSVTEITEILNQHRPLIKAMSFIGQSSAGKATKGFTQKEQLKVMKAFREGGYNTLISTCVGEEGLDIGDVDLIICFDAHKSPIRLVQRMGRTGRKRQGRIVMLLTEGKEEQTYNQSQYSKKSIDKAISKGSKSLAFYDRNHRLVPDGLQPVCHKMHVTIQSKYNATVKGRATGGGTKKTSSTGLKNLNTVQEAEDDGLLSEDQLRFWHKNLRVDEALPTLPVAGHAFATLQNHQDDLPDIGKRELSLSAWMPWQNRLQGSEKGGSSSKSKHLVEIMEFIDIQSAIDDDEDTYGEEMQLYLNEDDIVRRTKKKKRSSILNYCTPVSKEEEPLKKRKKSGMDAGHGGSKRRRVIPDLPVISSDEEPPGESSDDDLPLFGAHVQEKPNNNDKIEDQHVDEDLGTEGEPPPSNHDVIQINDDSNDVATAEPANPDKNHAVAKNKGLSKLKQKPVRKKSNLRSKKAKSCRNDTSRIEVIGDHDDEDFDLIADKSDTSASSVNKTAKNPSFDKSHENIPLEEVGHACDVPDDTRVGQESADYTDAGLEIPGVLQEHDDDVIRKEGLAMLLPLSGGNDGVSDIKTDCHPSRVLTPPSQDELEIALDDLDRKGRFSPVDLLELVDLWQSGTGNSKGISHGLASENLKSCPEPRASFMLPSSRPSSSHVKTSITSPLVISADSAFKQNGITCEQEPLPSSDVSDERPRRANSAHSCSKNDVARSQSNAAYDSPVKTDAQSSCKINPNTEKVSEFHSHDHISSESPQCIQTEYDVHSDHEERIKDNIEKPPMKRSADTQSRADDANADRADFGLSLEFEFEDDFEMEDEKSDGTSHNTPEAPQKTNVSNETEILTFHAGHDAVQSAVSRGDINKIVSGPGVLDGITPLNSKTLSRLNPSNTSTPFTNLKIGNQTINASSCHQSFMDNDLDDLLLAEMQTPHPTPGLNKPSNGKDNMVGTTPVRGGKGADSSMLTFTQALNWVHQSADEGSQYMSTSPSSVNSATSISLRPTSPLFSPKPAASKEASIATSTNPCILSQRSPTVRLPNGGNAAWGRKQTAAITPLKIVTDDQLHADDDDDDSADSPVFGQSQRRTTQRASSESPVFGSSAKTLNKSAGENNERLPAFCSEREMNDESSKDQATSGIDKVEPAFDLGFDLLDEFGDDDDDMLIPPSQPSTQPFSQTSYKSSLLSRVSTTPKVINDQKKQVLLQSDDESDEFLSQKQAGSRQDTLVLNSEYVDEASVSDSERLSPSLLDGHNHYTNGRSSKPGMISPPLGCLEKAARIDPSEKHVSMLSESNLQNLVDGIESDDDFDVEMDVGNLFSAPNQPLVSKLKEDRMQFEQHDLEEDENEESFIAPPKRRQKRSVPLLHSPEGLDLTAASKSDDSEVNIRCPSKQMKKSNARRALISSEEEETPVKKRLSTSSESSVSPVSFQTSVTDEDDDFVCERRQGRQLPKEKFVENPQKKKKKKTGLAHQFLEVEADLSGEECSSDEDYGSDEDKMDASFINDMTQMSQQSQQDVSVDMRVIYMQSVRSPGPLQGRFKLSHDRPFNKMDIFSQVPNEEEDESQYLEDSFCVDSNEEEGEEEDYSDEFSMVPVNLDETVGVKTRRGRQRAALKKVSEEHSHPATKQPGQRKRRIVHMIDSSSEEEHENVVDHKDVGSNDIEKQDAHAAHNTNKNRVHLSKSTDDSSHMMKPPSTDIRSVPTFGIKTTVQRSHKSSYSTSAHSRHKPLQSDGHSLRTMSGTGQPSQTSPTGLTQLPSLASRCQSRLGSNSRNVEGPSSSNVISGSRLQKTSLSSVRSDSSRTVAKASSQNYQTNSQSTSDASQTSQTSTGFTQLPSLATRCHTRLSNNTHAAIGGKKNVEKSDPAAAFDLGLDLLDDGDDFDDVEENCSTNVLTSSQVSYSVSDNQKSSVIPQTNREKPPDDNHSRHAADSVSKNDMPQTAEEQRQERIRLSRLKQQQFRQKYQAQNSGAVQTVAPPAGQDGESQSLFLKPGSVPPPHSKLSKSHSSFSPATASHSSGSHDDGADEHGFGSAIEEFPDTPVSSTPDLSSLNLSITDQSMNQSDKLTVLVDSREINGAQELVSSLRFQQNMNVAVRQLSSCDYILSNRMAAERKSISDFCNGANRSKLTERIQHMCDQFERPCLIIEKDRVKIGQKQSTKPWVRTKTVDNILACLSATHIKVLYSENQEESASILASLSRTEQRKQMHIMVPVTLSSGKEQVLQWYLSLPGVSFVMALNLVHGFSTVQQFANSSVKVIEKQGRMSTQRAKEVKAFVMHKYDKQMTVLRR